jgi:hypothetical protein
LADLIRDGDRRLSQLVIVQGRSDLGYDLFCNPGDTFAGMAAFKASDLEQTKEGLKVTFGSKAIFNQAIATYITAAAENHRKKVRP